QRAMARECGDAAARGLEERLFDIQEGRKPGVVWLLLDALDEVAPERAAQLRAELVSWAEIARAGSHLRIVVFSRAIGFEPLGPPFRIARLQPLLPEHQCRLLTTWLG